MTGETPFPEREDSIATFKAGMVRCLVNVNVLTTGFDAPRVDLLAMLRPTLSTGLYVQMVGRGTRKADGKVNCLILDFAGNCRRHGPVDRVASRSRRPERPSRRPRCAPRPARTAPRSTRSMPRVLAAATNGRSRSRWPSMRRPPTRSRS